MKHVLAGTLALTLLLWSGDALGLMYGSVSPGGGLNPGAILTVDETNGSGTLVGTPVPGFGLSSLAFDSSAQLFATTRLAGAGGGGAPPGSDLIQVNPLTGGLIQNVGAIQNGGGGDVGISDLTFQPGTDVLFGISSGEAPCAYCLYTINTASALATLIGSPGLANGGLAFDPSGVLYMVTSFAPVVVTLNPATGAVTSSVPGALPLDGLGIRPTDGAFFGTGPAGSDDIVSINPITGAMSIIGQTGAGKTTDLDFVPIPEPASGILTALGVVGIAILRRRR